MRTTITLCCLQMEILVTASGGDMSTDELGISHGGLISTLLDPGREGLAVTGFLSPAPPLPGAGVTV